MKDLGLLPSLQTVGERSFLASGIVAFVCGVAFTAVGDFAFSLSDLRELDLSRCIGISDVQQWACASCSRLRVVRLASGGKVGECAFAGSGAPELVVLGAEVVLRDDAFAHTHPVCVEFEGDEAQYPSLTELRCPPVRTRFGGEGRWHEWHDVAPGVVDWEIWNDDGNAEELRAPAGRPKALRVTGGAVKFKGCGCLVRVDLSGVALSVMSRGAFHRCHSLESVQLPSSVVCFADKCFRNCYRLRSVVGVEQRVELGVAAFSSTFALHECEWADQIRSVGLSALRFSGLERLKLEPDAAAGGVDLFGAGGLRWLHVPWRWAGRLTLSWCVSLRDITFGRADWSEEAFGFHPQNIRFGVASGGNIGPLRAAALQYTTILGEIAGLAERPSRPLFPP